MKRKPGRPTNWEDIVFRTGQNIWAAMVRAGMVAHPQYTPSRESLERLARAGLNATSSTQKQFEKDEKRRARKSC